MAINIFIPGQLENPAAKILVTDDKITLKVLFPDAKRLSEDDELEFVAFGESASEEAILKFLKDGTKDGVMKFLDGSGFISFHNTKVDTIYSTCISRKRLIVNGHEYNSIHFTKENTTRDKFTELLNKLREGKAYIAITTIDSDSILGEYDALYSERRMQASYDLKREQNLLYILEEECAVGYTERIYVDLDVVDLYLGLCIGNFHYRNDEIVINIDDGAMEIECFPISDEEQYYMICDENIIGVKIVEGNINEGIKKEEEE